MTVVVGYLAGKSGTSALHLGVEAARTLKTSLAVVTVVPKPWTTPSPARIDAEYATWADSSARDSPPSEAQRTRSARPRPGGQLPQVASRTGRVRRPAGGRRADSMPRRWCWARRADGAARTGGGRDRPTDWLLHSSPVPVAISPRGYRGSQAGGLTRITCAYSGTPGVGARRASASRRWPPGSRSRCGWSRYAIRGPHDVPARSGPARRGFDAGAWAAPATGHRWHAEDRRHRRRRRRRCR